MSLSQVFDYFSSFVLFYIPGMLQIYYQEFLKHITITSDIDKLNFNFEKSILILYYNTIVSLL